MLQHSYEIMNYWYYVKRIFTFFYEIFLLSFIDYLIISLLSYHLLYFLDFLKRFGDVYCILCNCEKTEIIYLDEKHLSNNLKIIEK